MGSSARVLGDDVEEFGTVAGGQGGADAGDAQQFFVGARAFDGEREERAIREHFERGNFFLACLGKAPGLQRFDEHGIRGVFEIFEPDTRSCS